MTYWLLVVVFTLLSQVSHIYPILDPGYIVKLYTLCPAENGTDFFTLKADVPAYAIARCQNGNFTFSTNAGPISRLPVSVTSNHSAQGVCVLNQKRNVNIYTITVEVGWGEPSNEMFMYEQQQSLQCSYDSHGSVESSSQVIQDLIIAPRENLHLQGNKSHNTYKLTLLNVLDQPIISQGLRMGRKVRLEAIMSGSAPGFQALSCSAKNIAGANYTILRGGCGDGAIIGRNEGFTTRPGGRLVHSPWFQAFKLRGGRDIVFDCVFTECVTDCPGSSCVNG